jgi:hypothetical protein
MAKATLIYYDKASLPDGGIVEMKIWSLPEKSLERRHGLKYSLYYGHRGDRIVGYGNEAGKGDHRHLRDQEMAYSFLSVEQLIADFLADVERERS